MKVKELGRVVMNSLFGPIPEMTKDDLDKYRDEHDLESYTLLDVRQPGEYEKDHIPGAKLIPLPDLSGRMDEVDRTKPVIAYCAIGGRSRAAAEFLAGRGYDEVYSLKGGIKAWDGPVAEGAEQSGMALFTGEESAARALAIAHGMEASLGQLYRDMAQRLDNQDTATLLRNLADVETAHKEKVRGMFEAAGPQEEDRALYEEMMESGLVEGGFQIEVLLTQHGDAQLSSSEVLDLAMTLEAQAMDLYMRLAERFQDPQASQGMLELSNDEQKHLSALARLREEQSG